MHIFRTSAVIAFALAGALSVTSAQAGTGPSLVSGGGKEASGMLAVDQRGADYEFAGGATLHAAPGAVLRILGRAQNLQLLPHKKIPTYSVILKSGRVDVSIPKKRSPSLAILVATSTETGGIAMGGDFTAIVARNRATHANRNGQVLVRSGPGWKPLAAGSVQSVVNGTTRVSALLPAPVIHGRFLRLAIDDRGTKLDDVGWPAIAGAASYQVELAGPDGPKTVSVRSNRLPDSMRALPPGDYRLRVRAVESDGMEGRAWSSVRINVVGVRVPKGSLTDDSGTIYLAPHAQVGLAHVGGLEMTYNKAPVYAPAASRVSLYRNRPTMVVLRRPGDKQTVELKLKPRGVRAEVALGPIDAVWPRDWIDIDVRLHGPKGAAVDSIDPKPRVTLGIDKLKLRWTRIGDRMHARVHPRHGAGPWVLRVEVTDRQGVVIGRNFMEIAQEQRISRTGN